MLLGGLGRMRCQRVSAATQYAKVILKQLWGLPPALDMDYEKRVHDGGAGDRARRAWPNRRTISAMAGWRWRWRNARSVRTASAPACRSDDGGSRPEFAAFPRGAVARSDFHSRTGAGAAKLPTSTASSAARIGVTMKERLQIGNAGTVLIDGEHPSVEAVSGKARSITCCILSEG